LVIFPFRHYPDRFDGFDLSPDFSGTPYSFGDKTKQKFDLWLDSAGNLNFCHTGIFAE
jgi:hypothetical protein